MLFCVFVLFFYQDSDIQPPRSDRLLPEQPWILLDGERQIANI